DFLSPWSGNRSPDGIWRIAGIWTGTGGNVLDPANAQLVTSYGGETGSFLLLTSRAGVLRGGEIQTLPTYGYGYYEVRMRVSAIRSSGSRDPATVRTSSTSNSSRTRAGSPRPTPAWSISRFTPATPRSFSACRSTPRVAFTGTASSGRPAASTSPWTAPWC